MAVMFKLNESTDMDPHACYLDPMVALQGLTQSPNMQMQPNPNQMVPGVGNQGNRPMLRNQLGQPQTQGERQSHL